MNVTAQKLQSLYALVCKSLAWRNHRTTLPQSRPCGRASSLREGAGKGCVPFIGVLANVRGFGRFSSPLRNSEVGTFHHSSGDTPSVSHSLNSSLREGAGNGWCHSTGYSLKSGGAGDFHRPYENSGGFLHFTIQRGAFPQGGSRGGCKLGGLGGAYPSLWAINQRDIPKRASCSGPGDGRN